MGPREQSNNNNKIILLSVPCLYYDSDWSMMTPCISMISSRTNQNHFLTQLHTHVSRLNLRRCLLHAMNSSSTDAALITLLHTVFNMLATQPYVRVFRLDFSKAIDTVRHATLMKKMACLALPDAIYNWINDFFKGHPHCTKFLNTL